MRLDGDDDFEVVFGGGGGGSGKDSGVPAFGDLHFMNPQAAHQKKWQKNFVADDGPTFENDHGFNFGDFHIMNPGAKLKEANLPVTFGFGGGGGGGAGGDLEVNFGFGGDDDEEDKNPFGFDIPSFGEFHILGAGKAHKDDVNKKHKKSGYAGRDGSKEPDVNAAHNPTDINFGDFHILNAGTKLKEAYLPVSFGFGGGGGGGAADDLEVSFGGGRDDESDDGRDLPAFGEFFIFGAPDKIGKPGDKKSGANAGPSEAQLADMPVSFGDFFIGGAPQAQTTKFAQVDMFSGGSGPGLEVTIGGFGGDDNDGPTHPSMMPFPELFSVNPQAKMPKFDTAVQDATDKFVRRMSQDHEAMEESMKFLNADDENSDDDEEESRPASPRPASPQSKKKPKTPEDSEDEESDVPPPAPKKKGKKVVESSSSEEEEDSDDSGSDSSDSDSD